MSETSTISWTDATWPIVAGCDYVSPGCSNCWAVRDSWRLAHNPHRQVRAAFAGTVRKTVEGALVWTGLVRPLPERLVWPLKWRGLKRVFVCSQADLFNQKVPFEFIAAAFGVMAMAPQHTFQVLTKHPARALEFFRWIENDADGPAAGCILHAREKIGFKSWPHEPMEAPIWPLANVWLGVTVEDQQRADERIPELLRCPAEKRWLSVEPQLEHIDLSKHLGIAQNHDDLRGMLHWVVCGGESAQTRANTRDFDISWARALRDQCRAAGTPFFMKQLGTSVTWNGITSPGQQWKSLKRVDKGEGFFRVLPPKGKTSRYKFHEPQHWPEDLRVQEFPI